MALQGPVNLVLLAVSSAARTCRAFEGTFVVARSAPVGKDPVTVGPGEWQSEFDNDDRTMHASAPPVTRETGGALPYLR